MSEAGERHLLVVDDDPRLRQLLQRFLMGEGYRVSVAQDLAEARHALETVMFDLIVLDVMLPDGDGVGFTAELRRHRDLPVLLLTARGEPDDRIAGLEAGAEDYLAKPFEPRELALRIATILRRSRPPAGEPLPIGHLRYDPVARELFDEAGPVRLTEGETALIDFLAARADRSLTRFEIATGVGLDGTDRAVDVAVTRLRRKIELDPKAPRLLVTVRGEGYMLKTGTDRWP
ncbi:MAG TPA: response regulator transcription factor [Geminicoccus sp.]|uniref:response regulator transcription factor n=1 Tax=Geminicoccus sp. TaxID=2024832 RepID=UPI002CA0712F|nr:response regulator transcription factor [Geminicoccus sp.]HWL69030.1 response regulator transcription factor [Geminicoccus sp.]